MVSSGRSRWSLPPPADTSPTYCIRPVPSMVTVAQNDYCSALVEGPTLFEVCSWYQFVKGFVLVPQELATVSLSGGEGRTFGSCVSCGADRQGCGHHGICSSTGRFNGCSADKASEHRHRAGVVSRPAPALGGHQVVGGV